MIAWCDRCARFLGETAPFDVYSLAHATCAECAAAAEHGPGPGVPAPWETAELAAKRAAFHAMLRDVCRTPRLDASPARHLVTDSARLGIRPLDLLFGAIQPALYEVGRRWSSDELTVGDERRFTAMCEGVLATVWDLYGAKHAFRHAARPTVLLANAQGNAHSLALRLLELLLSAEEVPNHVTHHGLSAPEILALVARHEAPIVGLSIASAVELEVVSAVARGLAELPAERRPRLLVGGFPFKRGLALPAGVHVEVLNDPGELVALARACVDLAAVGYEAAPR